MARSASSRPCPDPDCRGRTEPEQDGDLHYDECVVCGYATNWRRVTPAGDTPQSDTRCAVGVPEDVRRRASGFTTPPPPLLQIGRRHADP